MSGVHKVIAEHFRFFFSCLVTISLTVDKNINLPGKLEFQYRVSSINIPSRTHKLTYRKPTCDEKEAFY